MAEEPQENFPARRTRPGRLNRSLDLFQLLAHGGGDHLGPLVVGFPPPHCDAAVRVADDLELAGTAGLAGELECAASQGAAQRPRGEAVGDFDAGAGTRPEVEPLAVLQRTEDPDRDNVRAAPCRGASV